MGPWCNFKVLLYQRINGTPHIPTQVIDTYSRYKRCTVPTFKCTNSVTVRYLYFWEWSSFHHLGTSTEKILPSTLMDGGSSQAMLEAWEEHGAEWDLITFCVYLQDPLNFSPTDELYPTSQRGDFKPANGFQVLEESKRQKSPHVTSYTENQAQSTTAKSTMEDSHSQKRQTDRVDVAPSNHSEDIVDLDSSIDTRHVNKNHVHPQFLDLNLAEEDLLPSGTYITSGSVTQGQGSTDFNSQKGQEKLKTHHERLTHQSMTRRSPKHGDLITGSDGKKYRLLRGPSGPAGHPGKRVSHTIASNLHRVDDKWKEPYCYCSCFVVLLL